MLRRMIFPILLGVLGCGVLISLGLWQVQRMHWKEGVLAEIAAMAVADPVALPPAPTEAADEYRAVTVDGRFTGDIIEVLAGDGRDIPGVRVIEAFQTDTNRRILIDRGYLSYDARTIPRATHTALVVGNLLWPQDSNAYSPPPDQKSGLWYTRDLPAMAAKLGAEPILIVASTPTGDGIEPVPEDGAHLSNDHFGYAVQWFLLALVWAGMTLYLLWRIRQRTV